MPLRPLPCHLLRGPNKAEPRLLRGPNRAEPHSRRSPQGPNRVEPKLWCSPRGRQCGATSGPNRYRSQCFTNTGRLWHCGCSQTPCILYWGKMCPAGLALHHPAAELLREWTSYGCPTCTGRPWAPTEMQEAVDCGLHCSTMSNNAIAHFGAEVAEKVKSGQAKLVAWESIKDNPPTKLKISPIAAIPQKFKQF